MSIVRNFNLYLNAGNGSAPYINVNQYDQGEQWVFTLYKEDGTKYLPSTGAIVGIKADNRGIINTGTVDADGRVVINETQQMTAAAGIAIFELLIDGDSHGTANFLVNVEQRPGDNADLSDSDLSLIQQAVDSAEVIVEVIGDSDPSEVIGEHVDAWLDAHPEATTTVEDGAITAPKINQSLWDKLLVSEEASGAVASFDDGADGVPVKSLIAHINPVQSGSGDPSPTNVRPITGHSSVTVKKTGKNLMPSKADFTLNGITGTANADGSITLNGTATSSFNMTIASSLLLKAGTYTRELLGGVSGSMAFRTRKDTSGGTDIFGSGTINRVTTTLTEDTTVYCSVYISNGTTLTNQTLYPMLYYGDVDDMTFEGYTSTYYPISLGQSVYGGSVDLATGVLTVTHQSVQIDETSGFALYDHGSASAGGYYFSIRKSLNAEYYDRNPNGYFSHGRYVRQSISGQWRAFGDSNKRVVVVCLSDTDITTTAEANAFLQAQREAGTPLQVVYPLATPTTVQLTAQEVTTLLGENNIFVATGNVEVIYRADTKLYVDKMTAVDNNIIAPTEADFVATRNYTVNDLVIVADTLYKVTANIATGSAITPNSNVTQTTLSELIKALS